MSETKKPAKHKKLDIDPSSIRSNYAVTDDEEDYIYSKLINYYILLDDPDVTTQEKNEEKEIILSFLQPRKFSRY